MTRWYLCLLWAGICLPLASLAQTTPHLQWPSERLPLTEHLRWTLPASRPDSLPQPATRWLPQYARDNPSGYSFLCRQELAIERRWPIGLWVNLQEGEALRGTIMSTAHLRLRLLIE